MTPEFEFHRNFTAVVRAPRKYECRQIRSSLRTWHKLRGAMASPIRKLSMEELAAMALRHEPEIRLPLAEQVVFIRRAE